MSPLAQLQQQHQHPRLERVVRVARRAVGLDEDVVDWQRLVERDRPQRLREAPRSRR
ncbi:MAG: hypothetical protein R3C15_14165 [Thermoleophilia bacterium]